jgi:hypothetical protein
LKLIKKIEYLMILIEKYDPNSQEEINDDYWNRMSNLMTNETFIENIKAEKPDGKLQGQFLEGSWR